MCDHWFSVADNRDGHACNMCDHWFSVADNRDGHAMCVIIGSVGLITEMAMQYV